MRKPTRRRRGQVMIIIALGLTFIVSLGALAVDVIFVYVIKTFLVTATDAAGLGAARALGRGLTSAEQRTEVERVANQLFDFNFPDHLLMTGSSGQLKSPGVEVFSSSLPPTGWIQYDPSVPPGQRQVRLSGIAQAPTFFMRIFGVNSVNVGARAVAARRDVNLMLVVDRSGSMVLANPQPWPDLVSAAKFFVGNFDVTSDRVGLVTFGTNARADYSIVLPPVLWPEFKTGISAILDQHQAHSSNRTNSALAMYEAFRELAVLNDPNALNIIVFFTDGQPTAVSGNWTKLETNLISSPTIYSLLPALDGVIYTVQDFNNVRGIARNLAPTNRPVTGNGSDGGGDIVIHPQIVGSPDSVERLGRDMRQNRGGPGISTWIPPVWGAPGGALTFSYGLSTSGPRVRYQSPQLSLNTLLDNGTNAFDRGREVRYLAENLTMDIAARARMYSLLGTEGIRIYGIGLGGYLAPADHTFMQALANVKGTTHYQSTQPEGIYVYAPSPAQLRQAFQTVANEIFRLIQ